MSATQHRGSRKHVLDWIDSSDFIPQLNSMLEPTGARVDPSDPRMPRGSGNEVEARLERFGPEVLPDTDWRSLRDWWLAHHRGANTPNWDLAVACTIAGRRGLVLVEAKANASEVKRDGKMLATADPEAAQEGKRPSQNSRENHDRIAAAIEQARTELDARIPGWGISIDTHYQLSNRVAFAWRLATLGVPTILVYLGFLGDTGIRDVGEPFESTESWDTCFRRYAEGVIPAAAIEQPIDCGGGTFWLLVRSLPALSPSLPRRVR